MTRKWCAGADLVVQVQECSEDVDFVALVAGEWRYVGERCNAIGQNGEGRACVRNDDLQGVLGQRSVKASLTEPLPAENELRRRYP